MGDRLTRDWFHQALERVERDHPATPQPPDVRGVYRDAAGEWYAQHPASLARCALSLSPEQTMALNATVGGEWDEELDALARQYEVARRRKVAARLGIV